MENNDHIQIIATIGPASSDEKVFSQMVANGLDIARLNFAWGTLAEHEKTTAMIRAVEKHVGRKIPIMADLPGPRIQHGSSHTYDKTEGGELEQADKERIAFAVAHDYDYIAASFISSGKDVETYRVAIREYGGNQKLIAKIERKVAVDAIDEISAASDIIMIARGDMGNEIPLEQIPFVQASIIQKTNSAGKPVITATQMLLSMTKSPTPERAEVSDISDAVTEGTSAVMLSEESASGSYPVEAVAMMKKIVTEAEKQNRKITPIYLSNKAPAVPARTGRLFLVRHQESLWNAKSLWTGSRDIHLTQQGFADSRKIGELMRDLKYDYAFASMQVRSIETLTSILEEDHQYTVPTEYSSALNERSYGDYTGKNKWEMKEKVGEEVFEKMRRDWDYPIPSGETLKMVYERAVPFFIESILPLINKGSNVLVVSHGNTIRSLVKYIEHISDQDIAHVEMLFKSILIYDLDAAGHMIHKEIRTLEKIQ